MGSANLCARDTEPTEPVPPPEEEKTAEPTEPVEEKTTPPQETVPEKKKTELSDIDRSLEAVQKQREELLKKMGPTLELSDAELEKVAKILNRKRAKYPVMAQGNPVASQYAATPEQCLAKKINYSEPHFKKICKKPFMAPLYDPATEKPEDAKVCIDQFEFPNIPCEYPVVWTLTQDAADICQAMGKRLCDTHEWEGACAGSLKEPQYAFSKVKPSMDMNQKHKVLRQAHNPNREILWAYGKKKDHKKCATGSFKSKNCTMDSKQKEWETCGSNFYPVGHFPECKSTLGVYDQHGNAAEQMNIPFQESEMTSKGGIGYTELKGSWYIFSSYSAHEDDCHWRAPFWHGAAVAKSNDQHNHLGFRCCKDL